MNRLLTPDQVAEMTQLHVVTIRRLCARGEISATRIAGKWRIYEEGLEEWLAQGQPTDHGVIAPIRAPRKVTSERSTLRVLAGGA